MSKTIELRKSGPVVAEVDVLVVGAGIAGSTAAVTAARNGAKTMVVDRFGRPGGNMGPALIGGAPNLELPGPMAKIGMPGIPGEFVRRCEEYCGARLLSHYFRDSQVVSYVWLKMMEESGVQFMCNTFLMALISLLDQLAYHRQERGLLFVPDGAGRHMKGVNER